MNYRFTDLVDIEAFSLMLKSFYEATGVLHGLVDEQNNVISAIGWQEACADFHRVHPCARERCENSNRHLAANLPAEGYYGCKCQNGLMDYAAAIVVEGRQLATLYFGQVFHEPPDLEFFRRQAHEYDFDENAYLAAIRKVPVIPKERVDAIMAFYTQLAQMLACNGLDRLRLNQASDMLRQLTAQREQEYEEERKRVGHEIHEELGQNLAAMKLQLSSILAAARQGADVAPHVERAKRLLDGTIEVMRNVVVSIRPPVLNRGIEAALEWLGREFSRNTTIQCRVAVQEPNVDLDEDIEVVLFRVAEGALDNIARHADADAVDISLSWSNRRCLLEVRDNGKGFDTSLDREGCFGIHDMRERVLAMGGRMSIDSRPGHGTSVSVAIPIPAAADTQKA